MLARRDRAITLGLAGSNIIDQNTLGSTALGKIGLLEQRDIVIHRIDLERLEGGDEWCYRLKSLQIVFVVIDPVLFDDLHESLG